MLQNRKTHILIQNYTKIGRFRPFLLIYTQNKKKLTILVAGGTIAPFSKVLLTLTIFDRRKFAATPQNGQFWALRLLFLV